MLIASIPVVELLHDDPRQVSVLLARQGFEVAEGDRFHDNFVEMLRTHSAAFGLTRSQGEVLGPLLSGGASELDSLRSDRSQPPLTDFDPQVLSRLSAMDAPTAFACPVTQTLLCMRRLADLLGIQIKIFTIFNGQLSARKIGAKRAKRVHVYANADNEYAVLSRLDSNESLLSSTEADSISTTTTPPKPLDASMTTGTCMTVSSETGPRVRRLGAEGSATAGRSSEASLADGSAPTKSRAFGSFTERVSSEHDHQSPPSWGSQERRASRPEVSLKQLGRARFAAN